MDNEIVQVHIWELPEKTDDINKVNDFTLIHDGVELKKVAIEKLYEYFNQDYKIENITLFFETLIHNEDVRCQELYGQLDLSIETYDEIIKDLQAKLFTNRDEIRELETSTNQMDFDIEYLSKSFESIEAKHVSLSNHFESINEKKSFIESKDKDHDDNIAEIQASTNAINRHKTTIKNNNTHTSETVKTVSDDIDTQVVNKGELLTKSINDYYDRIVSIIDYYHHHNENKERE